MDKDVTVSAMAIIVVYVMTIVIYMSKNGDKTIQHNSALSGRDYYNEVMNSMSWRRFLNVTRMKKPCFIALLVKLKQTGGLRGTRHICAGEKLMIFLTLLKGIRTKY